MKTANTIEVTIPVTVSYLKKLIKDADAKIKDNDAFDLFINSDKFKKALGKDLLNTMTIATLVISWISLKIRSNLQTMILKIKHFNIEYSH